MSLNEELFPTTHEPERGPGRGSSEDDRETRHAPAADPGSGSGIPRRKRAGRPATTNPRRLLRVGGENRATVRLRPAGEGRQGAAAPLPGQGGRLVTGPNHTPVAATPDHGRDRRPPRHPAPTVPAPLLQRRHRAAGRARRAPRHAVRSGHAQALRPRFPSVRRPPLRTPGRHLQRPSVQPAAHDKLSTAPRNDAAADAPGAGRDRGTPPPAAVRTTWLGAGRYRPSRRPGRHQGPLPREPGG